MLENKCCLCQERNNATVYENVDEYTLMQCNCSGLVFIDKYPESLNNFIQDAQAQEEAKVEFWSVPNLYKKHRNIFDHFFAERLNLITSNGHELGEILDIGIGYGFWANYIRETARSIEGIDIAKEAISFSKSEYGLNAKLCSFELFESTKQYDTIFMVDVLEHFPEPIEMLKKANELLTENGKIYIQVPNVLGIKIPYKHGYGLPYHLWQYNLSTLTRVINAAGFKVDNYWTGIQGIIGHYEKGGPSLLTKLKWNLARKLKIGNRLQVVISKA